MQHGVLLPAGAPLSSLRVVSLSLSVSITALPICMLVLCLRILHRSLALCPVNLPHNHQSIWTVTNAVSQGHPSSFMLVLIRGWEPWHRYYFLPEKTDWAKGSSFASRSVGLPQWERGCNLPVHLFPVGILFGSCCRGGILQFVHPLGCRPQPHRSTRERLPLGMS